MRATCQPEMPPNASCSRLLTRIVTLAHAPSPVLTLSHSHSYSLTQSHASPLLLLTIPSILWALPPRHLQAHSLKADTVTLEVLRENIL